MNLEKMFKLYRKIKRFEHWELITFHMIAVISEILCIGFASKAYNYDQEWNEIVRSFDEDLLENITKEDLFRESKNEQAFIGIVSTVLVISVTYIFIYCYFYQKHYVWTIVNMAVNISIGLLFIVYCSIYIRTTLDFNTMYAELASRDEHDYTDFYFCHVNNFNDYMNLKKEHRQMIDSQKLCQLWGFKYAAASLAYLNSVIYWLIAATEYLLRKYVVRPSESEIELDIIELDEEPDVPDAEVVPNANSETGIEAV